MSATGQRSVASGPAGEVAVVGGGWSGIATAWYLRTRGVGAVVIERGESLGGRSAPGDLDGREITFGGKNIGHRYSCFRAFTDEMGDPEYEYFGINSSRIEDGRLRTVDSKHRVRSILGVLRKTPPREAARLLAMSWRVRREQSNRYIGSSYFDGLAERLGDPTLDRLFGDYLCSALVRAMTVRTNGAEPDEAHLGSFGTHLGALLDRYDQPRRGFGPVFEAFEASGPCELGAEVVELLVEGGAVTGVRVRLADGTVEDRHFGGVVLAIAAGAAARLLAAHLPAAAEELRAIRYFPVAVILARYARPVFAEDVRALVFPPDSPVSNAGAYGIGDRHIVRYTFSGRSAREAIDPFDPEQLLSDAEARLGSFIPIPAGSRQAFAAQRWQDGLCAYSRQHSARVARIRRLVTRLRGLHLTGDYVRGVSIEACFRAAREEAAAVARERREAYA